ncbi:hypothetical protein GQM09_21105, partial [Escherichia coli]|nr:hypothetical protein [Escherichia coli]
CYSMGGGRCPAVPCSLALPAGYFCEHALGFARSLKTQASVRIDAQIRAWLKRPGKGYHTRLNAVLRDTMLAKITHATSM